MIGDRVTRSDNPDGSPNFKTPKGLLHSQRNPREEAERFARVIAQTARGNPQSDIIVTGLGWGYIVEALHALDPRNALPIFFFEPLDSVRQHLRESGRETALKKIAPGRILDIMRSGLLHISPAHDRMYGAEIRRLLSSPPSVDESTQQVFFQRWFRHHLRFLCSAGSARFVPPLDGKKGPVIFCGAAPSLTRDLESITPDLRAGRAFVLAADTALAPLLSLGIRPDLVISVDAGRGTEFHFASAARLISDIRSIPILTWSGTSSVLHLYSDHLQYFRTTFPLDQLLGSGPLAEVPEWINPSRNTAGIALLAAKALGRVRMFHAGVSFKTENGRTHTRGTGYTLFAVLGQSRTKTVEMYQPKGYASDLTEKNRMASEGLLQMAADLDLQFHPAADQLRWKEELESRNAQTERTTSPVTGRSRTGDAAGRVWDRKALRAFVHGVREGIDLETIRRETGTADTGVEKWKRLFQKV